MDFNGPYGWRRAGTETTLRRIHSHLQNLEGMTWREIDLRTGPEGKRANHYLPVTAVCKSARQRLSELRLDDFEHLYQLRLSNTERIFGIRSNEIFSVLWWDPEHEVYPVAKL